MTSAALYDDIVIGSGLSAVGVVMGLAPGRRVLVLAGPDEGSFSYYDGRKTVPSAYLGYGGLGNAWHGVIPLRKQGLIPVSDAAFARMLDDFYPRISANAGRPLLFVPWRPIRPRITLRDRVARSAGRIELSGQLALRIDLQPSVPRVQTPAGWVHGSRIWVAAGALHTPSLLERSTGKALRRKHVADHVFCYAGQVEGASTPAVKRTSQGLLIESYDGGRDEALYTLRPARFSFRRLDHGIEQRAVFGLPTGNAVAKIFRSLSAGLIVEALYNKFGLFGAAPRHSVYAQVEVADAYRLESNGTLHPELLALRAAAARARGGSPFTALKPSKRPELYLPGIHLHHSLDLPAVTKLGLNLPGSPVQIVDASALRQIGPEHHSFRMMVRAMERAGQLSG